MPEYRPPTPQPEQPQPQEKHTEHEKKQTKHNKQKRNHQKQPPHSKEQKSTSVDIQAESTMTSTGDLTMKASLKEIQQAQGEWKLFVNNQQLENKKGNQQSEFTIPKDQLKTDKIPVTIQFNGEADGKKISGEWKQEVHREPSKAREKTIEMGHKYQVKENGNVVLTLWLKDQKQAQGEWKITLGDKEPVIQQGNEKFEYIIPKAQLQDGKTNIIVQFKGMIDGQPVVSETTLEMTVSNSQDNEAPAFHDEQSIPPTPDQEKPNNDTENDNTQEGIFDSTTIPPTIETPTSNNLLTKPSSTVIGGPLPKTATSLPFGLLTGAVILGFGAIILHLYHRKKHSA